MTIKRDELGPPLGAEHGLDDQAVAKLRRLAGDINKRYPDPADQGKREKALSVARALLLAKDEQAEAAVVHELGIARLDGRQAAEDAAVGLRQAAMQLVPVEEDRNARGVRSKQGFAKHAGAHITAVRSWLGIRR